MLTGTALDIVRTILVTIAAAFVVFGSIVCMKRDKILEEQQKEEIRKARAEERTHYALRLEAAADEFAESKATMKSIYKHQLDDMKQVLDEKDARIKQLERQVEIQNIVLTRASMTEASRNA